MQIEVHKYGGSSLSSCDKIVNIAKYTVAYQQAANVRVVLVLSAMGDYTNQLVDMASNISSSPNFKHLDSLLINGENTSCSLMAIALDALGKSAEVVNGVKIGIKTNSWFGHAAIESVDVSYINSLLGNNIIPVVTGFQGVNRYFESTTLGRGGSDLTAIVLANQLVAKCNIYTDVKGVYTADPRLIESARFIAKLSSDKMISMSKLGAQIMHPIAAKKVQDLDGSVWIRSAHSWDVLGTQVVADNYYQDDFAVILDQKTFIITVHLSVKSESMQQLRMMLANNSFSIDFIGGVSYQQSGEWRIIVADFDLSWCLDQLDKLAIKYFVSSQLIKVSVLSLAKFLASSQLQQYCIQAKKLDIKLNNLITRQDRLIALLADYDEALLLANTWHDLVLESDLLV